MPWRRIKRAQESPAEGARTQLWQTGKFVASNWQAPVIRRYQWFFVCSWYNRDNAFDPTMTGLTWNIVSYRAQFNFWRHPESKTDRSLKENNTYACTHRPLYLSRFKKTDSSVRRIYWPRFSSGRNARIWHNAQLMPTRGHLGCVFM